MATTGNSIIRRALMKIGAVSHHTVMLGGEADDGLVTLNEMLDNMALENLLIPRIVKREFSFVVGTGTYTIGAGGAFNTTRPIEIYRASIISFTDPTQPYEVPIEVIYTQRRQGIRLANLQSSWPKAVFYDKAYTAGLGSLIYHPIPTESGLKTALYVPEALAAFNLTTSVELPPGYETMLVHNLAVMLAPEYEMAVPELVLAIALSTKAKVKIKNIEPVEQACDPAMTRGGRQYDITADDTGTNL